MSDDTDDVRAELKELKARVRRLETLLDGGDVNPSPNTQDGLDSRDAAVIGSLDHGERVSKRELLKRYKRVTDIRQDSTARDRTEQLVKRDFFKHDSGEVVYVGE